MPEAFWNIWIDTGGTFTDCVAQDPTGNIYSLKVLSKSALRGRIEAKLDNSNFKASMKWGTDRNIFKEYRFQLLGKTHKPVKIQHIDFTKGIISLDPPLNISIDESLDFEISSGEEAPVLAARIVTATPLTRTLPPIRMRLGSTIGTNALLERKGAKTFLFVTCGFHDLLRIGNQQRPDIFSLKIPERLRLYDKVTEVSGRIASGGEVLNALDEKAVRAWSKTLKDENFESVAVSFLNSYINPAHERRFCALLREAGIGFVTGSSEIAPVINYLNRTETSVVNAYLDPIVRNYLSKISRHISGSYLKVMTSAGGLVDYEHFLPKDSLFSGPAGGIVGAVGAAQNTGISKIISFDMGGTSTDVARYGEKYEYQYETSVGGATIVSPSLSIETVASGGGSQCSFDGVKFSVGPESAGSAPGPACYGADGPLTVTDVNLLLGRLDEMNFGIPIKMHFAEAAFYKLMGDHQMEYNAEIILEGFLRIVNEKMATAIRKISVNKGYDPAGYTLLSFGGAGGQHACEVAEMLSIDRILVPYNAGVLSAAGMGHARIERFSICQVLKTFDIAGAELPDIIGQTSRYAVDKLLEENIAMEDIIIREVLIYLRFLGQETTLEILYEEDMDIAEAFRTKYENTYGHWIHNRKIEIESIKVIAAEKQRVDEHEDIEANPYNPHPTKHQKCWIDGAWYDIPVYIWEELHCGASIAGPALVTTSFSTILVKPDWSFYLNTHNHGLLQYLIKDIGARSQAMDHPYFDDSIQIELFTNRFISLAEEMGALLQRSSFSVNIKERLDYSCALLDQEGELIVNAPHIPVHLGGLGLCVRSILNAFEMKPGQVYMTNHPGFGGSHLPDITLVAPVFDVDKILVGFVANRAHHAELGGKRPGSMPPDASCLLEEGKVISPFCFVENGLARWDKIEEILTSDPYPTRSLEENLADLTGALASIQIGHDRLYSLCHAYGSSTIRFYMDYLKDYANEVLLRNVDKFERKDFSATEYLDDGSPIQVSITISDKSIEFDFTGSSGIHPGNLNATPAIVRSAILYILRLLCDENIPLNEGLMRSVGIKLPYGLLNPEFPADPGICPAVVGGNTETSQRLVDTLLKAFNLAACSQGTMNNFLFGDDQFSYYETLGGGVGALEGYHGASAVHQHMTNTRITDPEVLEFRYPVRLEHFGIRKDSGGKGRWTGGDGIIRTITFLTSLQITLLSQHRMEVPYGMKGGQHGLPGEQYLRRANGMIERLMGVDERDVNAGDTITILTPGGGGWGAER